MSFAEVYPAEPGSVPRIRRALTAWLAGHCIPPRRLADVGLALTEAVTNVIVHAYRERPQGTVAVCAEIASGELLLVVGDNGSGLRPDTGSPGLGLGLAIIARVADGIDLVTPPGGGFELRVRFALA